jgi:lactate dehydrogenase-like 2-hydroxyacid dehydrogenase
VSVQSNHIVLACAPASALFDALAAGTIAGAGLDVHRLELRQARDRFAALPKWSWRRVSPAARGSACSRRQPHSLPTCEPSLPVSRRRNGRVLPHASFTFSPADIRYDNKAIALGPMLSRLDRKIRERSGSRGTWIPPQTNPR